MGQIWAPKNTVYKEILWKPKATPYVILIQSHLENEGNIPYFQQEESWNIP